MHNVIHLPIKEKYPKPIFLGDGIYYCKKSQPYSINVFNEMQKRDVRFVLLCEEDASITDDYVPSIPPVNRRLDNKNFFNNGPGGWSFYGDGRYWILTTEGEFRLELER